MNVVQELNIEAGEELDAPIPVIEDFDKALAARFNTMMDEPIASVEELEATPALNEEELIEEGRRRVFQWAE